MLTVVAGPWGSGKTRWIGEQLAARSSSLEPALYISPATVGVDAHRLQIEVPQLQIETPLAEAAKIADQRTVYLELGYHLGLNLPWLAQLPHHRVAVISAHEPAPSEWRQWANQVVTSPVVMSETADLLNRSDFANFWQAPLRAQVLDPASLHMFWQELVQGAYGQMIRAKAIFELADGQSIHVDHLPGQDTTYQDLPLPQWLNGRPQRFSGIEMVGQQLDQAAIAATLRDCCLPDELLASHQAMLKQNQSHQAPHQAPLQPQKAI